MENTTMASRYIKRIASSPEDASLSGSSTGREDEKTIPFLRRLRDMLLENEDVISFVPGYRKNGQDILGQIVVHDRVNVEGHVLPRYFNHSSFASLRRQLNYFSFVRLGKGRQRESTYINEGVVEMDDILHLKRRSAGSAAVNQEEVIRKARVNNSMPLDDNESGDMSLESTTAPVVQPSAPIRSTDLKQRKKRRRHFKPVFSLPRTKSPVNNFISDEENSESRYSSALDSQSETDDEILAGCNALLGLTGKAWN